MGSVQFVEVLGKKRTGSEPGNDMVSELQRAFEKVVDHRAGVGASFARREEAVLEVANLVSQRQLEQELRRIEEGFEDKILINGVPFQRSHEAANGTYHSLCGPLNLPRRRYREVGRRSGSTVVPLELAAGLVEGTTPALGYSIGLDYTRLTSREYVESMAGAHRVVPSRSTVEGVAKTLGTKAREVAPSIERYLRPGEAVPAEAVAISVGLDRTSIPYEEPRAEEEPPKTRRKKRTKPYLRTPPPPVDVNYRMDYVATVSLVDTDAEMLEVRKYTATHEEGADGIVRRMMLDIRAWKKRRPDLEVGVVQDGAPELWNKLRAALQAEPSVESWHEAIDKFHLSERLGEVLKLTEQSAESAKTQLEDWIQELDEDDRTIDRIEKHLENSHWWMGANAPQKLEDALTYINNNKDRMRYVAIHANGLPVGSGITEGSCKSLTGTRVKRSGQRWHTDGVSAVLTLRAIHQSNRLPRFWKHLNKRYMAKVDNLAA